MPYVYTTDNALHDRQISRCRLIAQGSDNWAKVAAGKHHRFVPPHAWAHDTDTARDKLRAQLVARLDTLVAEAQTLKATMQTIDDLPIVDTAEGTPDAGPALGLEALL